MKLRFDEDFPGQLIPFGAKILFWNNPKRADNSSGKMSPTANDGVFLGYHIQPGLKLWTTMLRMAASPCSAHDA